MNEMLVLEKKRQLLYVKRELVALDEIIEDYKSNYNQAVEMLQDPQIASDEKRIKDLKWVRKSARKGMINAKMRRATAKYTEELLNENISELEEEL